jgi:hypothetical protein
MLIHGNPKDCQHERQHDGGKRSCNVQTCVFIPKSLNKQKKYYAYKLMQACGFEYVTSNRRFIQKFAENTVAKSPEKSTVAKHRDTGRN